MKISDKLKFLLKVANLSQEKLALLFAVSFVTLNSWINERSIPHNKKIILIDELYLKYTGQKIITEDILSAKKGFIFMKLKKHKNILKIILGSPDIYNQYLLTLTYNSNKIEGSTLSEDETASVLFENKVLPSKTLIEQLEVKNHQTAFAYFLNYINQEDSKIDENLILKLHSILMNSIRDDSGCYRNHAVRIVGSFVPTANCCKIPKLIEDLVSLIANSKEDIISLATKVHAFFEKIHPFSDGNGRIGRLILHAMFIKSNLPPVLIKQENKYLYYKYLQKAQLDEDYSLLEDFICDGLIDSFQILERI